MLVAMARKKSKSRLGAANTLMHDHVAAKDAIAEFELVPKLAAKGECMGAFDRALIASEDSGRAKRRGMGDGSAIFTDLDRAATRARVAFRNFCGGTRR
jgi:hypothetical protein